MWVRVLHRPDESTAKTGHSITHKRTTVHSGSPPILQRRDDLLCAAKAPNEKAQYEDQSNRRKDTNDKSGVMRQTDYGGEVVSEIGRAKHPDQHPKCCADRIEQQEA